MIQSEPELIALSAALAQEKFVLCHAELDVARRAEQSLFHADLLEATREAIRAGEDPLGDAFQDIRSGRARRDLGAVYTPSAIVNAMVRWVGSQATPGRIIDPGAGSGRFILRAAQQFPRAHLVAVEFDPVASLLLKANLAVLGLHRRTDVVVGDYRDLELPAYRGRTAFVGNPPYVRHHNIAQHWKSWYVARAQEQGAKASALAGLHLHFFLKTLLLAAKGDVGSFITSAEWLDVNYGSALRKLLLDRFGCAALHVLQPTVAAFPGTATTAAVTCFNVGEMQATMRVRSVSRVSQLDELTKGKPVSRERLASAPRWSVIIKPTGARARSGDVELGELFRVHRGQVTGANGVWIAGDHSTLLPRRVQFPSVTKARDLLHAGAQLESPERLKKVIDLPADLDELEAEDRQKVERFLDWARSVGAHQGYIASHRKQWWSVGLKAPAPILCTYMARRPPQFTMNLCAARHINVAHGLYPRQGIPDDRMHAIVAWLNENVGLEHGRTYAGGLVKFEPREMERLRLPADKLLIG
jgi:methylase of polypeptide subunit release factors